MIDKFYIWDVDDIPKSNKKYNTIFWNHFPKRKNGISIPDLVELQDDILKKEYLEVIYNMGNKFCGKKTIIEELQIRKNFSFWWMTLLTEKSNWAKTPQINNIIKVLALQKWLNKNNCKKLLIKSNNPKLIKTIELVCKTKKIKFIELKVDKKKKFIKYNYPFWLKAITWLIREYIYLIPYLFIKKYSFKKFDSSPIIISYFPLEEKELLDEKKINSSFWGPLPEFMNEKISPNWIYLPTRKFNFFKIKTFLKKANNQIHSKSSHIHIASFLTWKASLNTLIDSIKVYKKSYLIKKNSNLTEGILWPLIEDDFNKSLCGSDMVSSIFYFNIFEEAKNLSPKISKVIFLSENQPWEKALIHSFKSKTCKLIGFAHSTIRYWDLRYFNHPKNFKNEFIYKLPIPDQLAVHGKLDKKILSDSGYPPEAIIEVESLRYFYLKKFLHNMNKVTKGKKKLLVLGDYLTEDTKQILSILNDSKSDDVFKKIKIIIKSHPACPIKKADIKGLNAIISESNLGKLISESDVIFTGNISSASLEAYCMRKKIISLKNIKGLNFSPLRGYEGVNFIDNDHTFVKTLKRLLFSSETLESKNYFNLDSDLIRWKEILL